MAKREISATDQYRMLYPESAKHEACTREVTFLLGEDCTLRCTYCYQGCKSNDSMSWETAKGIVDFLFEMYDRDDKEAFINKDTEMIVLSFIGGEPLLYVDTMERICDYFVSEAIKRQHRWAQTFMISMASNGTEYFDPKCLAFLNKYKNRLSYSVSIDGPKEMHDACRVFPDGTGSFEVAKAAQDHFHTHFYNGIGTKATIARGNLPYLSYLILYYVEQGYEQIFANCVYEEEWNYEDAALLYQELKKTADYILSLDFDVDLSFFTEYGFMPKAEDDLLNWCGGTGAMLAFDPKGDAFPCIRYMHSSLNGDQEPLKIGDYKNGIYTTVADKKTFELLDSIDRRTQSTDECFYCPVGEGCSWCSGWNYQMFGTPNKRCTRICNMHQARSLANVYYWNKKYIKEGSKKFFKRYLPDDIALNIIEKEELELLSTLQSSAQQKAEEQSNKPHLSTEQIEKQLDIYLVSRGLNKENV